MWIWPFEIGMDAAERTPGAAAWNKNGASAMISKV
jgi:hypothetical protein